MQAAIDEMSRRREIQLAYNLENNITPRSIQRAIEVSMEYSKTSEFESEVMEEEEFYESGKTVLELIVELEKKMLSAAKNLNFEIAAELRDRIKRLREKDLKVIL
jgi:excinuclease ABC subunit B